MKKHIIITVCLLLSVYCHAQDKSWHFESTFRYEVDYDFDIQRTTSEPIDANAHFYVDIDRTGYGKFILYLAGNKTSFEVVDFVRGTPDQGYMITLRNYNSEIVHGGMTLTPALKPNEYYVQGIWIKNSRNNTGLLFYN